MTTSVIVKREKTISKTVEVLWSLIEPAENIPTWSPMADRSELISGQGKGRQQKIYTKWGKSLAEIEQEVTDYEPMKLIRWRHLKELINGKPAPSISKQVFFTIRLSPNDNGTLVTMLSENVPGNFFKGILIRIIAKPRIDAALKKSLEILSG